MNASAFLNAHPYQRTTARVDQANGFYRRRLTTRLGVLELTVPRTRSGCFHPQVLPRYQRREPVINEALKQVFLLGVSTRQTGRALATLVQDAVSAATVSRVAGLGWHSALGFDIPQSLQPNARVMCWVLHTWIIKCLGHHPSPKLTKTIATGILRLAPGDSPTSQPPSASSPTPA